MRVCALLLCGIIIALIAIDSVAPISQHICALLLMISNVVRHRNLNACDGVGTSKP